MRIGVEIANETRFIQNLHRLLTDARKAVPDVLVGYNSDHALYVHENLEIWNPGLRLLGKPRESGMGNYWDPVGARGPKFLEGPARENYHQYAWIITNAIISGRTVSEGLYAAGEELMKDSQGRVPVDSGDLVSSAFVRYDFAVTV